MKTQNPRDFQARLGHGSQSLNYLSSVGDKRGQAAGSPRSAVCLDDSLYAGLCRMVIQENARSSIHLYVDKAGRQDGIRGKADRSARIDFVEADAVNPAI
jgi:hypothetical protein